METIQGSCLCGAIAFEVEGPCKLSHCYCSRCRKMTGTERDTALLVRPDQVEITQGEELIKRWYLPSAKSFGTSVCRKCGGRAPHLTRGGSTMIIPAGLIDSELNPEKLGHFQWSSRANWVTLDESVLPCFD